MEYNIKKNDLYYLAGILIINIALVAYYINFNLNFGIFCSDVYLYLLNSLYFSGESINVAKIISYAPIISFLTAFLFKIGITGKIAIFIVTGVLAIIGNIGLFLLFKVKFNNLLSFLGTIIFMSFSINLLWLANGSIDIPAVALTIWAMLFTILGVNKDSRYLILALVCFTISFFIRPTVILFLPVMVLYYLSKRNFLDNLKDKNKFLKFDYKKKEYLYILIGILLSAAIFLVIINVISMGNNLVFLEQFGSAVSGEQVGIKDNAFNPNPWFYIENLPNFLSSSDVLFIDHKPFLANPSIFAYFFIGIIGVGLGIFISKSIGILKNYQIKKYKFELIVLLLLSIISILSFDRVSSVITIILTFLTLLLAQNIFKKLGFKNLTLSITFLAWILFPLIFLSYHDIKVDRYIIPSIVGLTYFIISSLYLIQSNFNKEKLFNAIYIIGIMFLIFSSFNFVNNFEDTNEFINQELIADALKEYDPDFKDKIVGTYHIRPSSWFLGQNVLGIPINQLDLLDEHNVTYYFSNKELDLKNFELIKSNDNFYLYKRIN